MFFVFWVLLEVMLNGGFWVYVCGLGSDVVIVSCCMGCE